MDFYKRITCICQHIPKGTVATYGQIALLAGRPQNARQVGYALSHRTVKDVPAHRVINAAGYLSGAAAFETPDTQKKLLASEQVPVNEEMRVNLKKYGWKHTYEDALHFREYFEEQGI